MAQKKLETVLAAQTIQVLARLAPAGPQRQQALARLRRRQATLATLVRNRPVDRRRRARAAKVLNQRRHTAMRRHRPKPDLAIQLKVQTRP